MRDEGRCAKGSSCPFSHDPALVAAARKEKEAKRQLPFGDQKGSKGSGKDGKGKSRPGSRSQSPGSKKKKEKGPAVAPIKTEVAEKVRGAVSTSAARNALMGQDANMSTGRSRAGKAQGSAPCSPMRNGRLLSASL